jgi:hypothetical protein
MGMNRLILLRSGDELAIYCVQSWRTIDIGRNDAARTYVLHAINTGSNAGDDFASNTRNKHSDVWKSPTHPAPAQLNDIACNTLPYAFAQMGLLPQHEGEHFIGNEEV